MNKITPVQQFLIVALLCLLTLGLFYQFYYRPKQDTLTTLRSDLETKQSTAQQYRAQVATIPELTARANKLEIERAEFVRALPTTQQFGQVLEQLRTNASATKTQITSLNFANNTNANLPAGVKPFDIDLAVKGQYGQIFQLLRSLETQNRFTTVNTVDLQLPQADSFNPTLQSNVKLTVYTFDPTQAATPTTATTGSDPAAAPAPAAPATTGGKP